MRRLGFVLAGVFLLGCAPETRAGDQGSVRRSSTDGVDGDVPLPDGGQQSSDDGGNCGVQNFTLVKGAVPDLLIVQDRSGSMSYDADDNMLSGAKNPKSKWVAMVTGLEQVVASETLIRWGLMMFSNDGVCGAPLEPDVPVAASAGPAITAALDHATPNGGTPTTAAIVNATAYLKDSSVDGDSHPKYLVLATDGEPTCGVFTDDDSVNAVMAVSDAAAAGIHTFVVGIGNNTGADETLSEMAMRGKEPNMTAGQKPYYSASTSADLVAVLNKIAGQIVSCSYALQTAPTHPDLVSIDGDGKALPRDPMHVNGWDFGPGNLSIVFFGAACDSLQQGVVTTLGAVYACPPIS